MFRTIIISLTTLFVLQFAGTAAAMGTFQFNWPHNDCWRVYRGNTQAASSCGTSADVDLQAGTYTVKPVGNDRFEPFTIHIHDTRTTTVTMGGVFRFEWPANDCWRIYDGSKQVQSSCGTNSSVALQAGRYEVRPVGNDRFYPFDITIQDGYETSASFGGMLEVQQPSNNCWRLYDGNKQMQSSCGTNAKVAVEAGVYTLKPVGSANFTPTRVTIRDGYVTTVRP